ncbi:hypothetical protein CANARDRAFT_7649 [[Candida] arabinofermentans NRRL YB-2248]|uniref:Histone chaperone RTT106 n=1 Tax=[Candida] arabinofermentans NRRL YB-2248 TaxID=983967 RepID=A0A1E4T1F0_9ASCO|nr:hypothetical protein CANARDRAFT_7649 [[Candida] arabinofermentans NRRL YB-2248]
MSFLDSLPTNLKIQVQDVFTAYPPSEDVIRALVEELTSSNSSANKRRKTAGGTELELAERPVETPPESLTGCHIILQIPELSIQSPVRKKLNLVFACFPGERTAFLALTKSIDSKPELVIKDLSPANITFAICLNFPEKKALKNLIIEYKHNMGDQYKNDPILIQFNNDSLTEQFGPLLEKTDLITYLQRQFEIMGFKMINGASKESKGFHVEAYKGSKEGYLYFLANHIIFGFRKPILIFNSTDIDSITYTSITRLTFNVTLHVSVPAVEGQERKLEKFEFSMIDQKEFEKIDQYVKNKEFRDKSMTDELKAQKQLKNNIENPGALAEAARLIPGGEQIVGDQNNGPVDSEDDEEVDGNYEESESESGSENEAGSGSDSDDSDDSDAGEDDNDINDDAQGQDLQNDQLDAEAQNNELDDGAGFLNFSGMEEEEEEEDDEE